MYDDLLRITGKPDKNYIYPFFWPDENAPEKIPEEVEAVYRSGCGGLCLEARPFEDFGGETWWHTAKTVLEEAKKRGMKVWILDDKHFPTGYANGGIEYKHPELRRHWLIEHHFDVYGPRTGLTVRLKDEDYEKIVYACMYRRGGENDILTGEPIRVEVREGAGFAGFDVPEGMWRVFFLIESTDWNRDHGLHIDMLSRESSRVLIDNVYEEHYKHLSEYFGNTLEGFFSDEPCFAAAHTERWGKDAGFYYRTVGQPGNALPWNVTVVDKMREAGITDLMSALPLLWYPCGGKEADVRFAYMDAVTSLWNENFSFAVGDWCRAHGLTYTGHIIEDNNAHSRLSASGGHYFRNLSGQDISGIDIVLHQVLPGFSDHDTAASISEGTASGSFFHYTLGHLASSLARITPHMRGRAMCELFGAYGWAEDSYIMKWLADFLLIRGVNRFVPHAFSVKHPFDDCPPHFYARGNNPQFGAFSALMPYINKVTSLLDGAVRKTDGAILYYAENEWVSDGDFLYGDKPAKALYDAHIDYDIIPVDSLKDARITDGRLVVNGLEHRFLVIPGARRYCAAVSSLAEKFIAAGLPVFTVTDDDRTYGGFGTLCTADELAGLVRAAGLSVDYGIPASKLRVAEFEKEDGRIFYLFNEHADETAEAEIVLPARGEYSELHILNDGFFGGSTADGKVRVKLLPGESVLYVFDGEKSPFAAKKELAAIQPLDIPWGIALKQTGIDTDFIPYKAHSGLINITALDEQPDFSGEIRYTGTFVCEGGDTMIDLGEVGSCAAIKVNGKTYPMRICAPFAWDISDAVRNGENEIEIVAANTLANRITDGFSAFLPIPASGVQGPIMISF